MDPKTGDVVMVKDKADARKAGLIPLTPEEHLAVEGMSKEERVKWVETVKLGHSPYGANRRWRRYAAKLVKQDQASKQESKEAKKETRESHRARRLRRRNYRKTRWKS